MPDQSNTNNTVSGRNVAAVLVGIIMGVSIGSIGALTGVYDWAIGIPMGIGVSAAIGIAVSLALRDSALGVYWSVSITSKQGWLTRCLHRRAILGFEGLPNEHSNSR